jgi:signal transduction histidine kinase
MDQYFPNKSIGAVTQRADTPVCPYNSVETVGANLRVRPSSTELTQPEGSHMRQSHIVELIRERPAEGAHTNGWLQHKAAGQGQAEEGLRQRIAELEARISDLEGFAHNVAHSLQTPLSHMVATAELLGEDYFGVLPNREIRRHVRMIVQNGLKMSVMIDSMLLLAGVHRRPVEIAPLDMASVVAEAQGQLALMIRDYQAEISAPQTWPVALGYRPWVEVVWLNYLSNAIKYGGHPPRLQLGATVPEDTEGMVRFWVRDNGPGLATEEQAQLFSRFTRLAPDRANGHGIGLSIVQGIVDKLGGQVGVESQMGMGSTFSFTLPGVAGVSRP